MGSAASYGRKTISLSAERRHGIDCGGPPRRDVTRERCDRREHHGRCADRDWVDGVDAKQERTEQPCHTERTQESNEEAGSAQRRSLTEDEPHEVSGPSAKRRPNADLVRAPHPPANMPRNQVRTRSGALASASS